MEEVEAELIEIKINRKLHEILIKDSIDIEEYYILISELNRRKGIVK